MGPPPVLPEEDLRVGYSVVAALLVSAVVAPPCERPGVDPVDPQCSVGRSLSGNRDSFHRSTSFKTELGHLQFEQTIAWNSENRLANVTFSSVHPQMGQWGGAIIGMHRSGAE